jgi:hypothetical protein
VVMPRSAACMGVFEHRRANGCKVLFTKNEPHTGLFEPARGSRLLTGFELPASFGALPAAFRLDPDGFGSDPDGLVVYPVKGMVSSNSSARFALPIQPPGQVARERAQKGVNP